MKSKIYTSYEEINKDLRILKVEKDLAYHKLLKEVEETKESLQLKNMIGDTPKKILNILSLFAGPLKSLAMTFLFKKIFK
ncbi:hypothetical protein FUA48_04125 [Flavobacterium alkalisoli]|uniref:Uncharacterized protein n=1 Tax=Flavobacterium alkalisoli TaxID=2602769 RepID=A0A5B9FRE9_9FLAO|nr:DUF6327 family protein [Flavobacterium alkalisoli]QEE48789.1 hypothetical protein FUA48_04125 [Flavobacterium alkalisoli]